MNRDYPNPRDHAEKILRIAQSNSAAATSAVAASWSRSVNQYGLSPGENPADSRLDSRSLALRREAIEQVVRVSQPAMDRLLSIIGASGCSVYLCDASGAIIDQRVRDADAEHFARAGLTIGADWSESAQGTNGIGTCIADARAVTIHRDQHFHSCNISMSCMGAPIFDAKGELAAVLDVSSCRQDVDGALVSLISHTVASTAQQIEADHFEEVYTRERIVRGRGDGQKGAVLFAVDRNDLIVGATRAARKLYHLSSDVLAKPLPAADILGDADQRGVGFEKAEARELHRALARAKGNMTAAARDLGISRATLYRRMAKHGLDTHR